MWAHELKLRRADQHFKELEAEVDRWVNVDGYAIISEPDPEPPDYVVKAKILRPVGGDPFSFLMGDFLQNARAALDYIAIALGDAGAGGFMAEADALQTMFPIVPDVDREGFSARGPDLFAQAAQRRLPTVSKAAVAAIERLQPHWELGEAWRVDGLWLLNELARFDRHRFLHVVTARTGEMRLDPATSRNIRVEAIEVERGAFFDMDEEGTELARLTAYPADAREEMYMHFKGALHIALDDDALPSSIPSHIADDPIESTCRGISIKLSQTLQELKPFLPSTPPP